MGPCLAFLTDKVLGVRCVTGHQMEGSVSPATPLAPVTAQLSPRPDPGDGPVCYNKQRPLIGCVGESFPLEKQSAADMPAGPSAKERALQLQDR